MPPISRGSLTKSRRVYPFSFWYSAFEPHRAYDKGLGKRIGIDPSKIRVPAFLPDNPEVRSDIADYLAEIQWFDRHLQSMIDLLRERGELDNTIIVVTSDNGMPFPRAKANLYEYGTHEPLAIYWGKNIPNGRRVSDLVSFTDFAPTFLETAGIPVPPEMSGKSLIAGPEIKKRGARRPLPQRCHHVPRTSCLGAAGGRANPGQGPQKG